MIRINAINSQQFGQSQSRAGGARRSSKPRWLFCALAGVMFAGSVAAQDDNSQRNAALSVVLVNDSEVVFTDYSQERNLGFQLGLEYLMGNDTQWAGFDLTVDEVQIAAEVWEDNVMPEAAQLPDATVWIAPVQSPKVHRLIQYTAELDRLLLVPATPSDQLPVAEHDHVFRTFYRWQEVERLLAEWVDHPAPLWVSAVNSDVRLRAEVQTIQVSPRSSGALAMEEVRQLATLQSDPVVVSSWPVMLDWLPMLNREAELQPGQIYAWLPDLGALTALLDFPGLQGMTYYYYDLPENEVNDWLVRTMLDRHDRLPSHYVVAGMNAALALLEALEAAASPEVADLQNALADLTWLGPQGELSLGASGETRMPLFATQLQIQPQLSWARPVLVTDGVRFTEH